MAKVSIIRVNEIVNKSRFLSLSPEHRGGEQRYVVHRTDCKPLAKSTLEKIFIGDDMDAFIDDGDGGFEVKF